jgi:hypothetical protein
VTRPLECSLAALLICASLLLAPAVASEDDDRPDHYVGLAAESLDEALVNLAEYNARLTVVLAREVLDARDLNEIHQLTYTLENALVRLGAEVTQLAETLEEVHLASESLDAETVRDAGRRYLDAAAPLHGHDRDPTH